MTTHFQLPAMINSIRNKALEIDFSGTDSGEKENIHIFDWADLSSDNTEDADDIIEYFMNDECLEKINNNELWPFALLGLTHNPSSFQELNNNGLLLIDLKSKSAENPRIIWFKDEQFALAAESFSELKISEVKEEAELPPADKNAHLVSPWKELWDQSIALAQEQKYAESLEVLDKLLSQFPENAEVLLALSQVYSSAGNYDQAEQHALLAQMEEPFTPKYSINLAKVYHGAEKWDKALKTAEEVISELADDGTQKRECAQCLALIGIAHYHLGKREEALQNLTKAKELHSMIGVSISGFNTILTELTTK